MMAMEARWLEALEDLGERLRTHREPSGVREAALGWAVEQTGAADGAFLVRAAEGWRCLTAWKDPGFWGRPWPLPEVPEGGAPVLWRLSEEAVAFLALPLGRGTEWLGLRGVPALEPASGWRAAGRMIVLALQAALEREAQSAFFSTAVHELRLPMTSIMGYADLLLKGLGGPLTENQRRFLETIRANIDRLAGLVSDLLEISRIEAGRLRLRIEPVDLAEALAEAVERIRPEAEARGHRLAVAVAEGLPPVAADRERLVRILIKGLDNAVKYTPPGGEIQVRADGGAEGVVCEIQDTGIGIREEEQPSLFTPFWRSEDPRVREVPGFGLSLTVARGVLQAMGGEIEIHSRPEAGTRLRLRFPPAGFLR